MLQLFSPAKINLFLRIVGKRPDGYHELSSLFQTIDLGDHLTYEPCERDSLTCSDPSLPTNSSNLVLKAVELFRRKTGLKVFFKIHLDKHIPYEAGLGGGSSNAATTLWACNLLAKTDIPTEKLRDWSAEIGSDIPFFFSQGTAYCTGRGENVYALPALPPRQLWVIKPQGGLSTPEVYRRLNLSVQEEMPGLAKQDLEKYLSGATPSFNDLEKAAFEMRPELNELKQSLLKNGFNTVLMSGSGSSFFCLGDGQLPSDPSYRLFSAQFINRASDRWY
ncbi:4-(cytidine 5'-diphospho)-2-C-methyl-D-erythritol kinase [Candidatus Protochlamydia phocaeensis]|uniref:4-(cytidine 5'-diphospho)-2-C-methyl-D-erythritol kinase n=1 Tax=Candidatus Protochlamydia phocaeensis TaxID=1414722 RepID=UPI000838ED53|nr:4-(cytidine 5'-diphospho)-2-C-methyl-D-erythritol kinase [Candidatus Protochlamydia phocaeensis]